jgi:hypothetical protein
MPRPKRLKVAPSAPALRVKRAAKFAIEIQEIPLEARAAYIDLYNVTDTDEEVSESAQPVIKKGRGRPPKRKALPVEEVVSEPADSLSCSGIGYVAPEAPIEESLLENIDLESSSPSVEIGRRERHSTTVESSFLSIANFRRRPRQPSILGRGASRVRSSSVESNQADSNGLASMSSRNVSTLSLGNFKRRPRQPSILGRSARSSSIGFDPDRATPAQPSSAWKIGNFKRRARESSILGSAQKQRQDRAYDNGDEDDFNPEDESTPLNLSKAVPMSTSSAVSSSNPRKRKLSAERLSKRSPAEPSLRGLQEPEAALTDAPLSDEDAEENDIPSSPPEAPIPSIEARNRDPMNETLALPQGSSPPESPADSPPVSRLTGRSQSQDYQPRGRRPFRGRTPPRATLDSPISSPPPLTHSPNRPARATARATPKSRARWQAAPPSTFSTAQLQTLLPRRRRQLNRDPYEIGSSDDEVDISGLASDNDELTNLSVAPQSRRPAGLFIRRPAPLRKPAKPRAASKPRAEAARGRTTYVSRANGTSDKENGQYDPDDSLAPLPDDAERNGSLENSLEFEQVKELKEAAKKFKEVDKWELEFEDVIASSSSPLGGR